MTDSVTAGGLFEQTTSDDLHTAAVEAVTRVVLQKWPGDPIPALHNAQLLVNMALDLGSRRAVVLAQGSDEDTYRLAHAVRTTGPNGACEHCRSVPYEGTPTEGDLRAAQQVIDTLLRSGG